MLIMCDIMHLKQAYPISIFTDWRVEGQLDANCMSEKKKSKLGVKIKSDEDESAQSVEAPWGKQSLFLSLLHLFSHIHIKSIQK